MSKVPDDLPGLFSNGTDALMIVKAPLINPEPPRPATALPTINILEETATPQRREPSSKTAKKLRKVTFDLKCVYNLPVKGCGEQL
jgi:hypothetical protein